MPKSKKKKTEDFKKVKLKVGKKLKKPTETNTSFKSGKVVLLEQLKRDGTTEGDHVPVTRRKLSLADLLHHLRHYNANVRKDGISGLKELLAENPYLVRSNLCTLIEYLGPLFNDSESDVLKSAASVWETIFTNVDSECLSPYFQLLSAHLNCALTHLNVDVKRFALKILNLLMTSHGDLLRRTSSFGLISCFLDTLPHTPATTSTGATVGRSLMTRSSKHELLKVVKNILSIFNTDTSKTNGNSDSSKQPNVIDCQSCSSAIISVSLSAAEWPQHRMELDDYVQPLISVPNEMDRSISFINSVVPFCHALWIEATSAEDQKSVDRFTFDLATLVIMNDILAVYNLLLRWPVSQLLASNNGISDVDCEKFRNCIRTTMTKGFVDRYNNLLPSRRAPRKSGEEALVSEHNLNADVCASVNFGLCRFLASLSVILEKQFPYPLEKISDYLLYCLSGEKKRMDTQTLRHGLELARDLRILLKDSGRYDLREFRDHYARLGHLIMNSLLNQCGRWKSKIDVLAWICKDLENMTEIEKWPKFNELVEKLPEILSPMIEEAKKLSRKADSTLFSSVLKLLHRLSRILLLRSQSLPINDAGKKAIESDLLCLLLSNIELYPSESRKEVLNLLYYAAPLREEVSNVIKTMAREKEGQETENLHKLLK